MIDVTPADAVILIGAVCIGLGLAEPSKFLARLHLDATTLVVMGVLIGTLGLLLKVVLE